jgi:hypothetical protein
VRRPYVEGDWFAVPLGDGTFASGIVTQGTRKAIFGSFYGSDPTLPLWSGRFSDRAIVQLRWPFLRAQPHFVRDEWPARVYGPAASPGYVERMLSAISHGERFDPERDAVRDVRAPIQAGAFDGIRGHLRVQWRDPLGARDLGIVEQLVAARADTSVRLHEGAAAQANAVARWANLARLELDTARMPDARATFPSITHLKLDGVPANLATALATFPALQTLSIRARGGAIDARAFSVASALRVLDLNGAAITHARALETLPHLRVLDVRDALADDADALLRLPVEALRLARVAGVRSIDALRGHPALRTLSLSGFLNLEDVSAIAALEYLTSLELLGLWQFDIADVAFIQTMPALRRLRIDIGGRRKNVEIYKQRSLALPLPFQEL